MAKRILITGANGFIGKNLVCDLRRQPDRFEPLCADIDTAPEQLRQYLESCDAVVHLAGVNRPKDEHEFVTGNTGSTESVTAQLLESGRAVPVVMTSSIQAALDNPYGKSKLAAEQALLAYARKSGAPVYLVRLPNVYGTWCRPNYNSAVATFCHNIARGLPITVSDRANPLTLIYIDDVLNLIEAALDGAVGPQPDGYCAVPDTCRTTLGDLVDLLFAFHAARETGKLPPLTEPLTKNLYSTYLSYLPEDAFSYPLTAHSDPRGAFSEFFKTDENGQFSVSTTVPGITRGNHWHHTKTEKFLVVSGTAAIRFRRIDRDEVLEYNVSGDRLQVVDIPPGYTHSITNTAPEGTLVTLIWANELLDPAHPDTYYLDV